MTDTVRRIPPLDTDEAWVLVFASLLSQVISLAVGVVGSMLLAGIATGDWMAATLGFGWLRGIAAALTVLAPLPAVAWGAGIASLTLAATHLNERRALASEEGRAAVHKTRRGINGELPRLPVLVLVPLMAITGFVEELLYRYVVIGLASALLAHILPDAAAMAAALLASSIAFWFVHGCYRDAGYAVIITALGLAFGTLYVASGSLAACAVAHTLYNLGVLGIARIKMSREPDYFGGPAPTRVYLDEDDGGDTPR